jgi:hypothetical protein
MTVLQNELTLSVNMASFMDAFDDKEKHKKQGVAVTAKRKKQEDFYADDEEAEYGDDRRNVPAREFERLERLKARMEEDSRSVMVPKSADGYVLQCPFCDSTSGVSCSDKKSGAIQYCASCDKTYRASKSDE